MPGLQTTQARTDELLADEEDVFQCCAIPEGYLLKAGEGGLFSSAALKKRYFRLENDTLSYFSGKAIGQPKGTINIKTIQHIALEESKKRVVMKVTTPNRVYTLSSDDEEILAQWCARLQRETKDNDVDSSKVSSDGKKTPSSMGRRFSAAGGMFKNAIIGDSVSPPGTIPAFKYDVTFEHGPLHMDLEADEYDRPIVSTFSKNEEGGPGPAESSGKIQVGDALMACNGDQLEPFDFSDAISIVIGHKWPRTLTFERPAAEPVPDSEGWLRKQGDSVKSALRRRMFKLFGATLFYYKPSRMNALKANVTPAGHIKMSDVSEIKMIYDKTRVGDEQYRLEIHTTLRVWLLCPDSVDSLKHWATVLSKSTDPPIKAGDLRIIENNSDNSSNGEQKVNSSSSEEGPVENGLLVKEGIVQRKDYFSDVRRPRQLQLHLNRLLFRPEGKPDAVPYTIDVSELARAARFINHDAPEGERDAVKLELKDSTSHEFMCDTTESAIQWVNSLRSLAPIRKKVEAGEDVDLNEFIKSTETNTNGDSVDAAEEESQVRARSNSQLTMDELEQIAEDKEEAQEAAEHEKEMEEKEVDHVKTYRLEGYMYKLGESKLGFLGAYRKRWFCLQKDQLTYFKHRTSSNMNSVLLNSICAGKINFKSVLEVRQSSISGCPDNTIEIVTPHRIYTVVPCSTESNNIMFDRWMKELTNAADIYGADYAEAQKMAASRQREEEKANKERIAALKASIVRSGMLGKKGKVNPTMKQRYFALVGQSLSYYVKEDDVYREDGDEIGCIDLANVSTMKYPTEDATILGKI